LQLEETVKNVDYTKGKIELYNKLGGPLDYDDFQTEIGNIANEFKTIQN
jgi:hypothetical protein